MRIWFVKVWRMDNGRPRFRVLGYAENGERWNEYCFICSQNVTHIATCSDGGPHLLMEIVESEEQAKETCKVGKLEFVKRRGNDDD